MIHHQTVLHYATLCCWLICTSFNAWTQTTPNNSNRPYSIFAPAIKNLQPQHKKCGLLLGINRTLDYQTLYLTYDPQQHTAKLSNRIPLLATPQNKHFHFIYAIINDTTIKEQHTQTIITNSKTSKRSITTTNYWRKSNTQLYLTNNKKYLPDIIEQLQQNRQKQIENYPNNCNNCTYSASDETAILTYIITQFANILQIKSTDHNTNNPYQSSTENTYKLLPISGTHYKKKLSEKNKNYRKAKFSDIEHNLYDICDKDLKNILQWKTTTAWFIDDIQGIQQHIFPETPDTDPEDIYFKYLQIDTTRIEPLLPAYAKNSLKARRTNNINQKQHLQDSIYAHHPLYILDTDKIDLLLYRYKAKVHLIAQAYAYIAPKYRKNTYPEIQIVQHDLGTIFPLYAQLPLKLEDFTAIDPRVVDIMVSPTQDIVCVWLSNSDLIAIDVASKREIYRKNFGEYDKIVMVEWATGIYTDIWRNNLTF